ncbi:hypothetical protein BJ912DRAFT_1060621 [Pholiota molesta]|nr:hypothetical protein BJ912DRAFT_1060621 [Pholiota molesta]
MSTVRIESHSPPPKGSCPALSILCPAARAEAHDPSAASLPPARPLWHTTINTRVRNRTKNEDELSPVLGPGHLHPAPLVSFASSLQPSICFSTWVLAAVLSADAPRIAPGACTVPLIGDGLEAQDVVELIFGELGIWDGNYPIPRSHSCPQAFQPSSPQSLSALDPLRFMLVLVSFNVLSHAQELVARNFLGRIREAER